MTSPLGPWLMKSVSIHRDEGDWVWSAVLANGAVIRDSLDIDATSSTYVARLAAAHTVVDFVGEMTGHVAVIDWEANGTVNVSPPPANADATRELALAVIGACPAATRYLMWTDAYRLGTPDAGPYWVSAQMIGPFLERDQPTPDDLARLGALFESLLADGREEIRECLQTELADSRRDPAWAVLAEYGGPLVRRWLTA